MAATPRKSQIFRVQKYTSGAASMTMPTQNSHLLMSRKFHQISVSLSRKGSVRAYPDHRPYRIIDPHSDDAHQYLRTEKQEPLAKFQPLLQRAKSR